MSSLPRITVVGHPFAPIGMGEHLRATYRSLAAVGAHAAVRDVYGPSALDPVLKAEFDGHVVQDFSDINIFVLNGDEIQPSLRHLQTDLPRESLNIVYPAWELSHYPEVWAEQLEKFDEVWAASEFTHAALQSAVRKPVIHRPLPGEIRFGKIHGRRRFRIPESSFVFLFFFDFTSYVERKNPLATLCAFEELRNFFVDEDLYLVIKTKGGSSGSPVYQSFCESLVGVDRVMIIDELLGEDEIKSLIWCSDCFVSLHRSEGFGFGLSAAMFSGKPVVATGYSGNLDYMTEENSCLVRYSLSPVPSGAYPFWEGQVWADPDVEHARTYMEKLFFEPHWARQIGEAASRHIRAHFSYRACGLRYLSRIADCKSSFALNSDRTHARLATGRP